MRCLGKFLSLVGVFLVCALQGAALGQTTSSNSWSPIGQMTQPRTGAAAVLLPNGNILITGGSDASGVPQASAEIYSPRTAAFSAASPMNVPRANHAAIVLTTGDVLVTGGNTTGGGYSDSAEIYSAATGQWTLLQASLGQGLASHAMANLPDGNVLIAGGQSTVGVVSSILLFRNSDHSIAPIGQLLTARTGAVAAATPDGRVLIAGGSDINGAALASTEIFTYSAATTSGAVAAGPNMSYPRTGATATSTYDGVAIIGGNNGSADLSTAEIFSQWTNAFRVVSGGIPRSGHFAVLLPNNGSILAMGGTGGQAVDLLQPWANSLAGAFVPAANSLTNQNGGFAVPASLGSLLAAGGQGDAASSAEAYRFPTIATDQADYPPGTPVVMTGTGFQPGEIVDLHLHVWVNQTTSDLPDYTVTAGADGTFTFDGYAPDTTDLGARYHLTAVGESSGLQAQVIFTDGGTPTVTCTPGAVAVNSTATCTATIPGQSGSGDTIQWSSSGGGSFTSTSCMISSGNPGTCSVTFTPSNAPTGGQTITATDGSKSASFPLNVYGSPTKLVFTAQPSGGLAGSPFATQPSVTIEDANGNVVTNSSASIALAITSGTGTAGASLTCTADPLAASSGVAAFSGCKIDFAGSSYELTASSAALTPAVSSPFTITSNNQLSSVSVGAQTGALTYGTAGSVTYIVTVTPVSGNTAFTADLSIIGTLPSGVTASWSPSSITFGASAAAQSATLTLSTTTAAAAQTGTSFTVTATNHSLSSDTKSNTGSLTIGQAGATLSVTNSPATYNGSAQSAKVQGSVAGTVSNVSYTGTSGTTYGPSTAAPTNAGSYAVTANFTPTDTTDYQTLTSASAGTFVISQASTTTTVASSGNPSAYGQSVTFTASVSVTAPGAGTPTGTVTFTVDGTPQTPTAITGSSATFTTSALSVSGSPHSISAAYNGDSNFLTSNGSLTGGQGVKKADTSTTVGAITPEPSVVGQAYTVNVAVAAIAPGAGDPSGTVTIGDGATTCTATLSSGSGSCQLTSTTAATKTISATYNDDANFNTSSNTGSHTVNPSPTTTTFTSGLTTVTVVGQPYTVGVAVAAEAPGSGTPTGTVTIGDGATTCTATLSSGSGSCSLTSTSAGAKKITATYNSDGNYSTSSADGAHQVNQAATSTAVASSVNPSVYGQSVTFTATVSVTSPGAGTPTGTVTFTIDGVAQTPSPISGGTATFTSSSLGASTTAHTVSAAYDGDSNFLTSNGSLTAGQTVNKASTTTAVTSSLNPTVFGQSVTFTATVSPVLPGAGTPTGTVTFTIDGVAQTPSTISGGTASFATTSLGASTTAHTVSVAFDGDSNFLTSSDSLAGGQTVNKASTTTTVTSSTNPSVFGQSVTFTATVSVTAPGAGTPTGTIAFTVDGVAQTPTTLSGSTVTFTTSSLSVNGSPHLVSAAYSGDSNFVTSSGNLAAGQTVNQAKTTTTVTSSANPSVLNQSVTFTATVGVTAPGAGTPTGTVIFYIDGVAQPASNLTGYTATLTTSTFGASGTGHTVSATYSGDSNFLTSSGSLAGGQVVQYAAGGICDGDLGHQILQPISVSGSSVFKSNSTTPAKFRVCDANGVSIGTAGVVQSFRIVGVVAGTASTVDEAVSSTTPDAAFRWDPTAQQWIFNISNKSIGSANQTYLFLITLNDGSTIPFQYGLR